MKKINFIFGFIAVAAFNQNINAQEVTSQDFKTEEVKNQDIKTGFKLGLNFTNIKEDGVDTKNKVGFHAGVFIEAFLGEKFSIQPELLYSTQGAKEEIKTSVPFFFSGEAKLKLDYINIPIMFKYYLADSFSITAGPQVGFLVNSKIEYSSTYGSGFNLDSDDTKSLFNKFDYAWNFGVEYNTNGLFFAARYNLGLANIYSNKNNNFYISDDVTARNRVFQISTGYKF